MTVEGKKVAKTKLRELWQAVKKFKSGDPKRSNGDLIQDVTNSYDIHGLSSMVDATPIFDPPCVQEKGVTNDQIKSNLQKKHKQKTTKKYLQRKKIQ